MAISDPIADGLTKIRNASYAGHKTVDIRASRFFCSILDVLKREGFIRAYKPLGEARPARELRVYLKYAEKKMPAISQISRVSKPGRREYRKASSLPRVLGGMGIAVMSTSRGVMTERDAFRQRMGGEIVCYVW